jgi:putative hydrolase of the HAD superfamily
MQAIAFDFGNVVGFFDHRITLNRLTAFTDMSVEDMFAAVYDSPLEGAFESGRIAAADFLKEVRQLCRLACDDRTMIEAWSDIFTPNTEVCALIQLLKPRYRLLLGSNTNELHSRRYRRQFAGTLSHFDHLILSHEIGMRKPQPEFFEHCRRLANCSVADCLFIDDMPDNIAGARACGWKGIVYTHFHDLQQRLEELGIRSSL